MSVEKRILKLISDVNVGTNRLNEEIFSELLDIFNETYYSKNYGIDGEKEELLYHYITQGWLLGNNPGFGFSTTEYLRSYTDVADSGVNPLLHYCVYGKSENRTPFAQFFVTEQRTIDSETISRLLNFMDLGFYCEFNSLQIVFRSEYQALQHYMNIGWHNNYDPSRRFSTRFYLQNNPDIRKSGVNPLLHYVTVGIKEGRRCLPRSTGPKHNPFSLLKAAGVVAAPPTSEFLELREDVLLILPIYNSHKDLDDLFESLRETVTPEQPMYLVDDSSPDRSVDLVLKKFKAHFSRAEFNYRKENKGFSAAVNDGIGISAGRHVILLNSDLRLPQKWLSRIMDPIDRNPNQVASVTPFSNSSSLTGFPNVINESELFLGLTINELDACFKGIQSSDEFLPAGCGFCMALNSKAVKKVGGFRGNIYGRGYYEETDWSELATNAGFLHAVATNLFVEHKPNSSSFSTDERVRLSLENHRKFDRSFPSYKYAKRSYLANDPLNAIRDTAKIRAMFSRSATSKLVITHRWGGGIQTFIQNEKEQNTDQKTLFCIAEMEGSTTHLKFEFDSEIVRGAVQTEDISTLLDFGFDKAEFHSFHAFEEVAKVLFSLLPNLNGTRCAYYVHDYHAICPSPHLMGSQNVFCGLPEVNKCRRCFTLNEHTVSHAPSVAAWRKQWGQFLSHMEEIFVFSNSSKLLFESIYPNLPVTHYPSQYRPNLRPIIIQQQSSLNVAVLGRIGMHKGSHTVQRFAQYLTARSSGDRISVIGEWHGGKLPSNCVVTGGYTVPELPATLEHLGINVALFPTVCPETYSFTLSELFDMEIGVVGYNIGSQGERIRDYAKGVAVPLSANMAEIYRALKMARNKLA